MSLGGGAGQHLEDYRALRTQLEANVLALATSVDGRSFEFQAPLHGLMLPPGGYAMLEHGTGCASRRCSQCSCPADPPDPLTALATDYAVRIATEGRKFGLYLLVCTQRPQKVQQNVISQCDNLVLMRMASEADLAYTGTILGYVPQQLLAGATAFRQGEALVAGKLASHPALIKFGRRVAEEGGSDVEASWAAVR